MCIFEIPKRNIKLLRDFRKLPNPKPTSCRNKDNLNWDKKVKSIIFENLGKFPAVFIPKSR